MIPAVPFPSIHAEELKTVQTKACTCLIAMTKKAHKPKRPSVDEWISDMGWHILQRHIIWP